jgi:hypothetical protein
MSEDFVRHARDKGYSYIRRCLKPADIYNVANPTVVQSKGIERLRKSIDLCKKYGLLCVPEIHKIYEEPVRFLDPEFVTFMGNYAKEMSQFDPEWVILEIINEPTPGGTWKYNDTAWYDQQNQIVEAMRENAPDHTIGIVASMCFPDTSWRGGDSEINWDNIYTLQRLIMPDPSIRNIVVTIHDYYPFAFTHQGASWVAFYGEINNLKYPPDAGNVKWAKNRTDNEYADKCLDEYLMVGWSAEVFDERYAMVAQWRREHGPYVYVGEFGAQENTGGGRDQYYRDITAAMNKHQVGWSHWWGAGQSTLGLDSELPAYEVDEQTVETQRYEKLAVKGNVRERTVAAVPEFFHIPRENFYGTVLTLTGRSLNIAPPYTALSHGVKPGGTSILIYRNEKMR